MPATCNVNLVLLDLIFQTVIRRRVEITNVLFILVSRDSAVGIATGYGLDD
jgi:hypothetical protein